MGKKSKKKNFWVIRPINMILIGLTLAVTSLLFFYDKKLFYIVGVIVAIAVIFAVYKLTRIQRDIYKVVKSVNGEVGEIYNNNLIDFPICALIVNTNYEIIWYNDTFRTTVLKDQPDVFGKNIEVETNVPLQQIKTNPGYMICYHDHYYESYCFDTQTDDAAKLYMLYLIDVTSLQKTSLEYDLSRPAVMILIIDSYDESIRNLNDRERSSLLGEIQKVIQDMMDQTKGFVQRVYEDRYIIVMEKRYIDTLKEQRFDILDKVKAIVTHERVPVTLSIGIGNVTESLQQAEQDARQALDMALGRGGDQAAIKTNGGYEFFGGLSKGIEKRTKVKTRIVANALVELIEQSDNVLIMGHKFADLDCLGSAIGMAKACRCLGKEAFIVVDPKRNLANCLVQMMANNGQQDIFISPDQALGFIKEHTLVIIVDTHAQSLVESPAIYKRCKNVVVIDHHRKLVNYIDKAVVFYHEPYSSSTSEMVTELIQYFGEKCRITHVEAEALLAGIMLDTRNFIIKTGVRTFEAAAYLRKLGADTVEVRKLFASTMDSYQQKSRLVASAEIYNRCAIAICDFSSEDIRIVSSQAADELLGISGVDASFVLFEDNDAVNVSARSMGALNVQIVMEKIGGGGHHTMAAAQVKNSNCEKVRQMLFEIIDECYK